MVVAAGGFAGALVAQPVGQFAETLAVAVAEGLAVLDKQRKMSARN